MSKRIMSALLAVLMIFFLFPVAVSAMGQLSVAVTVDKTEYTRGDTVVATIKMNGINADITGVQFRLHYNPSELSFVNAKGGTFGNAFENSEFTVVNSGAGNYAYCQADNIQAIMLNGEASFAVVTFTVIGRSVSKFNLEVCDITDDFVESYNPAVTQTRINVKNDGTIPIVSGISYRGMSIRLDPNKPEGLRFKMAISESFLANVKEAGILVGAAANFGHTAPAKELTLDDVGEKAIRTVVYNSDAAVNQYFQKVDGYYEYIVVLVNTNGRDGIMDYVNKHFVFREYAITKSGEVIYGDYTGMSHSDGATATAGEGLWRSIAHVAKQIVDSGYVGVPDEYRTRIDQFASK